MEYVDNKSIEGLKIEIIQQVAESIEFAVNALKDDPEDKTEVSEETLRQTAQDVLTSYAPAVLDAFVESYRRSQLKTPDLEAVSLIFKQMAIRAKLLEMCGRSPEQNIFPRVKIETRHGFVVGKLYDMSEHDDQEAIHLGIGDTDEWISLASITGVSEEPVE